MAEIENGWAVGALLLVLGIWATSYFVSRMRRSEHAAQAADEVESRPIELCEGPVTLRGVVRTDDGKPAIRARITQHGTEGHGKHGWRHRWTEVEREIEVRPFFVDLPEKKGSIWVDPSVEIVFADDLDVTSRTAPDRRVRKARLRAGESVSVEGELARGPWPVEAGGEGGGESYREGPSVGWVLRPGKRAMVSTRHLAETSRWWAAFFRQNALAAAILTVGVQGVWGWAFYRWALEGVHCRAEVFDRELREVDTGRHSHTAWMIATRTFESCPSPGEVFWIEVTSDDYRSWDDGDWVDWFLLPSDPREHYEGSTAQAPTELVMPLGMLIAAAAILGWMRAKQLSRWWDGGRVIEVGAGRLAESVPLYEAEASEAEKERAPKKRGKGARAGASGERGSA